MTTEKLSITITDDMGSIASAIKAGITTLELMESWLSDNGVECEIDEDCLIIGNTIYADCPECPTELEFNDCAHEEAAQQYVDGGDWGDSKSTAWIPIRTYRKGINDEGDIEILDEESHTITIEPVEPDCIDGEEHDWQSPIELVGGIKENPGVWGNGGGVIINEVCIHCGCGRKTNTWAQNPSTGEQGLRSVEYKENEYDLSELKK